MLYFYEWKAASHIFPKVGERNCKSEPYSSPAAVRHVSGAKFPAAQNRSIASHSLVPGKQRKISGGKRFERSLGV